MRSLRKIGVAALAALTLAACGTDDTGGAAPGQSAVDSAQGEIDLTFWHAMGGLNGQALQSLVDKFNAAHAGKIKVTPVYQGSYTDLLAKYSASVRSKSTPDVVMTYDVGTGFMADAGQTVPAQDLAAANPGQLDLGKLRPAAKAYYTVGGKLLSVPFNTSTPMLYVNDDMLAKAGLPADASLSTLDDVAMVAEKVHQAGAGSGFTQPYDGWYAENLTSASGSTLCTPGNGRGGDHATGVNLTAPAQVSAFAKVGQLYHDGSALDTGADGNQALAAFNGGKVALMLNSSGAAGQVRKSAGFRWRALPYPVSGDRSMSGPIIGGASLWVSGPGHSSAEQAASWQLISFLDNPENQAAFSQATGYVPVHTDSANVPAYQQALTNQPELRTAIQQLDETPVTEATSGCLSGALTAVRTDVISALQLAFGGSVPLEQALSAAQTKANSDISTYLQQIGK